jgi:hypothetical protein
VHASRYWRPSTRSGTGFAVDRVSPKVTTDPASDQPSDGVEMLESSESTEGGTQIFVGTLRGPSVGVKVAQNATVDVRFSAALSHDRSLGEVVRRLSAHSSAWCTEC